MFLSHPEDWLPCYITTHHYGGDSDNIGVFLHLPYTGLGPCRALKVQSGCSFFLKEEQGKLVVPVEIVDNSTVKNRNKEKCRHLHWCPKRMSHSSPFSCPAMLFIQ